MNGREKMGNQQTKPSREEEEEGRTLAANPNC